MQIVDGIAMKKSALQQVSIQGKMHRQFILRISPLQKCSLVMMIIIIIRLKMRKWQKYLYLTIMGGLTTTTISACYWQSSRYLQAKKRWRVIAQQLSNDNPQNITQIQQLNAFKYLRIDGILSEKYVLISRARQSRMGYLIVKPLFYGINSEKKCILAVQGWIPQQFVYESKEKQKQFKGILREKQKKDYLHHKMKEADLQKFKMNTYIDVEKVHKELNLQEYQIQQKYYFQILKSVEGSEKENHYPYQYSVDNFQLPYLTPDKHRAYATFWGLTTLVGLMGISKGFKIKV